MTSRHQRAIGLLALAACTGCAEYRAENPALTQYPGIQSQIENFYDAKPPRTTGCATLHR